jgi:hypothetical protein
MKLLRHFRSHENIITLLDIMVHNGESSGGHGAHSSSNSTSTSGHGTSGGGSSATGSGLVSLDDFNVSLIPVRVLDRYELIYELHIVHYAFSVLQDIYLVTNLMESDLERIINSR